MNESEQNKKEFYNKLNTKELEVYAEQGDAEKLKRTLPKRLNGTLRQLNKDIHQPKTTLVHAIIMGQGLNKIIKKPLSGF